LRKVSLDLLLRDLGGLSLSEAHGSVNRLLAGEQVEVAFADRSAAEEFARRADEMGAECIVAEA
jgi:hypothetical protein